MRRVKAKGGISRLGIRVVRFSDIQCTQNVKYCDRRQDVVQEMEGK